MHKATRYIYPIFWLDMMFFKFLRKGIILYLQSAMLIVLSLSISYLIGNLFFYKKASGSLIHDHAGNVRGSYLLTQNFKGDKYFHPRLSISFASKCDVALYNDVFRDSINARYKAKPYIEDISMIAPSSSLRDPYIKRDEAIRQAELVAKARDLELATVIEIINRYTIFASWPFFELDVVNVTILNAYLDGI